jgi:hypothetical protein
MVSKDRMISHWYVRRIYRRPLIDEQTPYNTSRVQIRPHLVWLISCPSTYSSIISTERMKSPANQNHRSVFHVLKPANTCVSCLLPLDRHSDDLQEILLFLSEVELSSVWCQPSLKSSFSIVHFDLLDSNPSLFINWLSTIQLTSNNVRKLTLALPKRQTFKFPSDVTCSLLQVPQKLSVMLAINPNLLLKPRILKVLLVPFR